jgi:hypothetical protein
MIHPEDRDRALSITTALYAVRLATAGAQVTPEQSKDMIVDASREAAHILMAVSRHLPAPAQTFVSTGPRPAEGA